MTLPMFSYDNEVIKKITDYSLLGAHNKFFQDMNNFQISDGSIFVTIIWIIALTIAVIWAFKWNKNISFVKNWEHTLIVTRGELYASNSYQNCPKNSYLKI